ncbi:MAG: hypothetical protein KAY24_06020 [Candidatus Eisenbacteria sp.]|nr:hypothetical protein [Candidatus Eisenbacteria bacterium]
MSKASCAFWVGIWLVCANQLGWAQDEASRYESLDELMARYRAHASSLPSLRGEERTERALEFFTTVPWDQIHYLCIKDNPTVTPASSGILMDIVRGKLHSEAPLVDEMVFLLTDPSTCRACLQATVMYISHEKVGYRERPEGGRLAKAMLELADTGTLEQGICFALEQGAAYLSASEDIMRRMTAHCHSGVPERIEHGIAMLGDSKDERAADTLVAMVDRLAVDPSATRKAKASAMRHAAERAGLAAYEPIRGVFESAPDRPLRWDALKGLALTQDPRARPLILAEYADGTTGIADSTNTMEDLDNRRFYYELWFMTRLAEPGLMRVLGEGEPEEIALALELLDRESRFGLPESRETLYSALEARRGMTGDPAERTRIEEILARFRAYPEQRVESDL